MQRVFHGTLDVLPSSEKNHTQKSTLTMKKQWCETERTADCKQKHTVLCFNCSCLGPESINSGFNSVGKSFLVLGLTYCALSIWY